MKSEPKHYLFPFKKKNSLMNKPIIVPECKRDCCEKTLWSTNYACRQIPLIISELQLFIKANSVGPILEIILQKKMFFKSYYLCILIKMYL